MIEATKTVVVEDNISSHPRSSKNPLYRIRPVADDVDPRFNGHEQLFDGHRVEAPPTKPMALPKTDHILGQVPRQPTTAHDSSKPARRTRVRIVHD